MAPIPADWAVYMAFVGAALTLILGVIFMISPQRGLAVTQHHAEELPKIMAGHYFFMTLLALCAALTGSLLTIAIVFAGLAGIALFDTWIYFRAGKRIGPHLNAGIGALLVVGVALWGRS